jgi:hypothetical protein
MGKYNNKLKILIETIVSHVFSIKSLRQHRLYLRYPIIATLKENMYYGMNAIAPKVLIWATFI